MYFDKLSNIPPAGPGQGGLKSVKIFLVNASVCPEQREVIGYAVVLSASCCS